VSTDSINKLIWDIGASAAILEAPKQKAVHDHKQEGANGTREMLSVQGGGSRCTPPIAASSVSMVAATSPMCEGPERSR
jgi:hypothetical protein